MMLTVSEALKPQAPTGTWRNWLIAKHLCAGSFALVLVLGMLGVLCFEQYWFVKDGIIRSETVKGSEPIWTSSTFGGRHCSGYKLYLSHFDGIDSVTSEKNVSAGIAVRYVISPTLKLAELLPEGISREAWLWHKVCTGETILIAFACGCMLFAAYDQLRKARRVLARLPIEEEASLVFDLVPGKLLPKPLKPKIPLRQQFENAFVTIGSVFFGLGVLTFVLGIPMFFLAMCIAPTASKPAGPMVFAASMGFICIGWWLHSAKDVILKNTDWRSAK